MPPNRTRTRCNTDGYVFSARYGSTSSRGDWLAAYYYARIESLAVIASYAQDDWVRWGNGPQTESSRICHQIPERSFSLVPPAKQ
jgi:hypothetical protein